MRFQKLIRTQLAVAGFAVALSLAGGAKAQEIENTTFDDGPYVAPFTQTAPPQDASNASAIPALPGSQANHTTEPTSASTNASAQVSAPVQQASVEQVPSAPMVWAGAAVVSIIAVGLYARGSGKRLTRDVRSPRSPCTSIRSA